MLTKLTTAYLVLCEFGWRHSNFLPRTVERFHKNLHHHDAWHTSLAPKRQRSLLMSIGLCLIILAAELERIPACIHARRFWPTHIFTPGGNSLKLELLDGLTCLRQLILLSTHLVMSKHIRACGIVDVSVIQPSHSDSSILYRARGHVFYFLPKKRVPAMLCRFLHFLPHFLLSLSKLPATTSLVDIKQDTRRKSLLNAQ